MRGEDSLVVHKFGGTSLASSAHYDHVASLLVRQGGKQAVVVSAMAGVTDGLLQLCRLASMRDATLREHHEALLVRHREVIETLLSGSPQQRLLELLERDGQAILDICRGISLMRSATEQAQEYVAGHGEVWSARLLAALLEQRGADGRFVDAREVLVVTTNGDFQDVWWEESRNRTGHLALWTEGSIPVITGYVATTPEGIVTTLKRNGSDHSAAIFANLLRAQELIIWTDVDGVLSADPRRVPEAVVTREMSYEEAIELAYFGAKVLHPATMGPAIAQGIPIYIKNTQRPAATGTRIGHQPGRSTDEPGSADRPVKGFASIDAIALLNVEGTGMLGVPGVAERVFGALKERGISVILIAQASSEHSICVAVREEHGTIARTILEEAFAGELARRQIQGIECRLSCAILAAVGDGMAQTPGVAGRMMTALGRAGVNILAVAQGSSERNISVVVDKNDATRGLRAVHAGFYLSDQTLSVALLGPGLIGQALLAQLHQQAELLRREYNIDVRVRAIANSRRMWLAEDGFDIGQWKNQMHDGGQPLSHTHLLEHLCATHLPHAVLVDCTAADIGELYETASGRGVHIITPNKKVGAGDLTRYQRLRTQGRRKGVHWFYEATVGAGLPVITTMRDLMQTGDTIHRVEGVLSGTLSYLFNTFTAEDSFAALVADARARGYTEPDPRDDLSGMDVARKVVILAREMGVSLDLADVAIESLVPPSLAQTLSPDEFLLALRDEDSNMREKLRAATAEQCVLRYVGVVDRERGAHVALRPYPKHHAFARVQGSDNIFAFTTDRYRQQPLIVQGPGAGPEVTAAGVFADLLRLAAHLGARS